MNEPLITINGKPLTDGQAMTVRVALQSFAISLVNDGLGEDEHAENMVTAYMARIKELNKLIEMSNANV